MNYYYYTIDTFIIFIVKCIAIYASKTMCKKCIRGCGGLWADMNWQKWGGPHTGGERVWITAHRTSVALSALLRLHWAMIQHDAFKSDHQMQVSHAQTSADFISTHIGCWPALLNQGPAQRFLSGVCRDHDMMGLECEWSVT